MTKPKFNERWPRDNHILAAIYRALCLPIWAVDMLFFAACNNPSTVNRVVSRMRKAGLVSRHPLYGRFIYLRMGPEAATKYGLKPTDCEPLDYHRLLAAMATVMYCFAEPDRIRKRALPSEVEETFSIPTQHLYSRPYVIRTFPDKPPELLQIRVAMDAQAGNVLSRHQEAMNEYREHASMRQLIDDGRFVMVTFFPTEAAWEPARTLFEQERAKGKYFSQFETFVYPDLLKIAGQKGALK